MDIGDLVSDGRESGDLDIENVAREDVASADLDNDDFADQVDDNELADDDLDNDELANDELDDAELADDDLDNDELANDELDDAELADDELDDDVDIAPGDQNLGDNLPAQRRGPAVGPRPRPAAGARRIGRHWGRFAELWVPEPLREARVDPGRRGALILLLIAAFAATATAVGVWRDQPELRPVETELAGIAVTSTGQSLPTVTAGSASTAAPADPLPAADSPTSVAPPGEVVVSVTGLVGKPGLVTLPAGARVADAIAAAGGAAAEADLTGMNLAARLADGDSVVVGNGAGGAGVVSGVDPVSQGADAAGPSGPAGTSNPEIINLNTADEAALDTLPGVGPVMAQNILGWRQTNGSFTSVEQLQEISGIGPSRYAQIAPMVTVS